MKKAIYIAYPIFLILNALSSAYYLFMGQWKGYVWLFGAAELLLTIVALIIFILSIIRKKVFASTSLLAVGVLSAMQLFPLINALFIYTSYFKNGIFHLFVLVLGIFLLSNYLSMERQKGEIF